MMSAELSVGFKGDRKYIYGPDMLNAAMSEISEKSNGAAICQLDFRIHRMSAQNLILHWCPKEEEKFESSTAIATFNFLLEEVPYAAILDQATTIDNARQPYNEAAVTDQCMFSPETRTVQLTGMPQGFSPVETLVSMNKHLHLQALTKPEDSQWIFCRWESARWPLPNDLSGVMLTIDQVLGSRLTRARAELNKRIIGHIYFSAGKAI